MSSTINGSDGFNSGKLGSFNNPAPNAKAIIMAGTSVGNGLYWLKNSNINNGTPFQAYCDMTTQGGGWILVLTVNGSIVQNMGWTDSNVLFRNTSTPSIENSYSILGWSDYLKDIMNNNWQWMVEATDIYTTRNTYGGIFTSNVASYSFLATNPNQTNITANLWFNGLSFAENSGIGPRVPWIDTSYASAANAVLTTYPGSSSWWGTIVQSDDSYSSYRTGPWISGTFQAPMYKRLWIR